MHDKYIEGMTEKKLNLIKEMTKKQRFYNEYQSIKYDNKGKVSFLVIAVTLPSGEVEVITNSHNIESKVEYYKKAYTDDLVHAMNDKVSIVNWMFI